MLKRTQILFALLIAAVLLTTAWVAGRSWTKPKLVAFVVAAADLSPGHILTAADLDLISIPADTAISPGYTELEQLIGQPVRHAIRSGEIIHPHRIGEAAGLMYPQPETGHRLLTLELPPAQANGGWLAAGNRVDLYLLPSQNQEQQPICVENIRITAVLSPHRQSASAQEPPVTSNLMVCLDLSQSEADQIIPLLSSCKAYLSIVNESD